MPGRNFKENFDGLFHMREGWSSEESRGAPDGAEELWAIKVQQGSDDINIVTTKAFEYPLPKNNRSSHIKCWGKWNMLLHCTFQ